METKTFVTPFNFSVNDMKLISWAKQKNDNHNINLLPPPPKKNENRNLKNVEKLYLFSPM